MSQPDILPLERLVSYLCLFEIIALINLKISSRSLAVVFGKDSTSCESPAYRSCNRVFWAPQCILATYSHFRFLRYLFKAAATTIAAACRFLAGSVSNNYEFNTDKHASHALYHFILGIKMKINCRFILTNRNEIIAIHPQCC